MNKRGIRCLIGSTLVYVMGQLFWGGEMLLPAWAASPTLPFGDANKQAWQSNLFNGKFNQPSNNQPSNKQPSNKQLSNKQLNRSFNEYSDRHFNWQLKGGNLQFVLQFYEDNDRVTQQIWRHPLSPAALWKIVKQDLIKAGWRAELEPPELVKEAALLASPKLLMRAKRLESSKLLGSAKRVEQARPSGSPGSSDPPARLGDVPIKSFISHTWLKANTSLSLVIMPLDKASGVMAILRSKGG